MKRRKATQTSHQQQFQAGLLLGKQYQHFVSPYKVAPPTTQLELRLLAVSCIPNHEGMEGRAYEALVDGWVAGYCQ